MGPPDDRILMHSFQRAVRRKTFSLVILLVVGGATLFLSPPGATAIFVTALVATIFAVGMLVLAYLPIGRGEAEAPRASETEAPRASDEPPTAA